MSKEKFVALFEGLRNIIKIMLKLAVSGLRSELRTSGMRSTSATHSGTEIDGLPRSAGGTGMNEMFLSVGECNPAYFCQSRSYQNYYTALRNNFSDGGKWSREEKNSPCCNTVSDACTAPRGT
jgi:hypothetical protein